MSKTRHLLRHPYETCCIETAMTTSQTSERCFFATSAALFAITAALTIAGSTSMSTMDATPMPGGWTMSMMWMRMPGQTWGGAAASFIAMWCVMMAAMMLPSLIPTLRRYRQAVSATDGRQAGLLALLVGTGYFVVWTAFGMLVFLLGATLTAAEMQWPALARSVPLMAGAIVLIAGAVQFTHWKTCRLARCREALRHTAALPAHATSAWEQGMYLGLHCCLSCANLTAIQLVIGVMDLRAMVFVTVAITAERLVPASKLVAQAIGLVAIGAGMVLLV
jgi:predicted metal-binding membrane protein